ncbi:MAG: hypothetical protein ABIA91_01780 [Patescibacteria group bacterium]
MLNWIKKMFSSSKKKSQNKNFDNIIIGKIMELKSHSNADKLQLAITDIGQTEPVQVVCGGTNLREGMFVAMALPGAKVKWHGQGESIVLEETKIRGEKSYGMICASNEIGIQDKFPCGEMEVIDLLNIPNLEVGKQLSQYI